MDWTLGPYRWEHSFSRPSTPKLEAPDSTFVSQVLTECEVRALCCMLVDNSEDKAKLQSSWSLRWGRRGFLCTARHHPPLLIWRMTQALLVLILASIQLCSSWFSPSPRTLGVPLLLSDRTKKNLPVYPSGQHLPCILSGLTWKPGSR